MRKLTGYVCMLAIMGLLACSNTKVLTSWKAQGTEPQKFNKVLVIGMMGERDRVLRESMETAMVQQLQANGITAISATQQYGPKTFRKMKEEDAIKMVNNDGFDGVMVVELIDKNKERYYVPGYIDYTPYGVMRGYWWPHYQVIYDRIYSPGYYSVSTSYCLEINLYDSKNDRLNYSAQTKTIDPTTAQNFADNVSKLVVGDMLKQGVIMK